MFDELKSVKSLSLKISFFASIFLLLFISWITLFSYLYFFLSELDSFDEKLNTISSDLSPDTISDAIVMKLESVNIIDDDKISFSISSSWDEITTKEDATIKEDTSSGLTFSLWITKEQYDEYVLIKKEHEKNVLREETVIERNPSLVHNWFFNITTAEIPAKKIDEKQPIFELARDSLIIDRNWKYTANWIFNFESFDIEYLIIKSPWIFIQNIWERQYLFRKIATSDYEIVFAKDISYLKDFAFKMLLVGIISSILFFILVYILSTYLIRLFLKPINEYNTKLKEYNHNLAHEIKTPLTIVNMNLDLLENDDNKDIVESNKDEIKKIKNITDSLLFLSENFTLREIQKIEINTCVREYLEKSTNKDKVEVIYNKKDVEVMANKNMFDRLLKNLIENAVKYSSDRKLTIKIKETWIIFENNVEKCISDKELINVFEAFYQVESSRTDSGYWLWLTLVKRIVDIFKWKVNIKCRNNIFKVEIGF